ncbi:hypothetical protein EMCRGX_G029648 [Ephydatia muelleri]
MAAHVESPTLLQLKKDLLLCFRECSDKGLLHAANWAIELANSIATVEQPAVPDVHRSSLFHAESIQYYVGKSLFDLREFRRAAHALIDCKSDEAFFLRSYSLYFAGEKAKEDEQVDVIGTVEPAEFVNKELLGLKSALATRAGQLDGYGYYLYGIVLKELKQAEDARQMLLKSVHLCPLLWSSWQELAKLCDSRDMLYGLPVPAHWLRDFFLAAGSLELLLTDDALAYYTNLSQVGFGSSSYIHSQLALVHYHTKEFNLAAANFECVRSLDPYKLTTLDTYSNVLFVMERLNDLCRLAQDAVKIDKYRAETCSVLGNFYSLEGDHEKAVAYFRRAVRLNRHDQSAWILLGHEYLELKNCTMAIEAYNREANRHDFRAYYGLGHTYEILKMPYFALHYYKQSFKLKSSDPRVLYALGYCYDQLGQVEEAKRCYKKAIAYHDQEGTALIRLAKLHARLGEGDDAVKLYTRFVAQAETSKVGVHHPEEQGPAHLFLSHYYVEKRCYAEAEAHAHKSTEFVATREEGRSLLHEVLKLKAERHVPWIIIENNIPITSWLAWRCWRSFNGTYLHVVVALVMVGITLWYWTAQTRYSGSSTTAVHNYGVVIDAGSSGSKVYIFHWPPHDGDPEKLLDIQYLLDPYGVPYTKKVQPGLHTFVSTPSAAYDGLKPLLDFAMELVPADRYPETPLYLLGTAGLRLVPEAEQKNLTSYLYEVLSTMYPFHLPQDSISIISGKMEGVFSWIAVNYLLGRFSSHHDGITTVGSLDMGGASLQIAFEIPPDAEVSPSNTLELDLGCGFHGNSHKHRIFLATYLGFGTNEIWRKYQMSLADLDMESDGNTTVLVPRMTINTPCLPPDLTENATLGDYPVKLKGVGNFYGCRRALRPLLHTNQATHPCFDGSCSDSFLSPPSVEYRHLEFYGLSEFWYSMHDLLLVGEDYSRADFERAAKGFCETNWKTLLSRFRNNLYPTADIYRMKSQCLKSSWLSLIIHDGFGFPGNFSNLHSVSYINGQRVQWPLGAILHHTRFLPLREIQQRTRNLHSVLSSGGGVAFLLPCLVVIIVAVILLACSCRDRRQHLPRSMSVASISRVTQTLLGRSQSVGRLSTIAPA